MKYSEVLYQFHPLETGDFMYRYYINEREYIIYSPVQGEISCLELCNFKDLTPYELAISIQRVISEKLELEEFFFEYTCSREKLITYLFDVSNIGEDKKIRCISNNMGYLLYELKTSHKVRNLYQLNSNGECQLLFENEVCYASIFEEVSNNSVNICWNPAVFSLIEEEKNNATPSYLLASSNPILCAGIIKKIEEKSASINLCVNKNSMEALLFLAYYTDYRNVQKGISVSCNNKMVTVLMRNWQPISLVRFVSKIQKKCKEDFLKVYKEIQEHEVIFYHIESTAGLSFITFSMNSIVIDTFLKHIIVELHLDNISILEL